MEEEKKGKRESLGEKDKAVFWEILKTHGGGKLWKTITSQGKNNTARHEAWKTAANAFSEHLSRSFTADQAKQLHKRIKDAKKKEHDRKAIESEFRKSCSATGGGSGAPPPLQGDGDDLQDENYLEELDPSETPFNQMVAPCDREFFSLGFNSQKKRIPLAELSSTPTSKCSKVYKSSMTNVTHVGSKPRPSPKYPSPSTIRLPDNPLTSYPPPMVSPISKFRSSPPPVTRQVLPPTHLSSVPSKLDDNQQLMSNCDEILFTEAPLAPGKLNLLGDVNEPGTSASTKNLSETFGRSVSFEEPGRSEESFRVLVAPGVASDSRAEQIYFETEGNVKIISTVKETPKHKRAPKGKVRTAPSKKTMNDEATNYYSTMLKLQKKLICQKSAYYKRKDRVEFLKQKLLEASYKKEGLCVPDYGDSSSSESESDSELE